MQKGTFALFIVSMALVAGITAAPLTRGLHNLGNTCFMNATLQALAHVPEFVTEVKNRASTSNDAALLNTVFDEMKKKDGSYSPNYFVTNFLRKLQSPWFGHFLNVSGGQEDALDFFSTMFGKILLQNNVFNIKTRYRYLCGNSSIDRDTAEPDAVYHSVLFEDSTSPLALQDLVRRDFDFADYPKDVLRCSACNKARKEHREKMQRRLCFTPEPPRYLVLALARQRQSGNTRWKSKTPINVVDTGLFLPSCSGSADMYDLCAVVVHSGYSLDSGHYIAYARNLAGGDMSWYLFDDGALPVQVSDDAMLRLLYPKDEEYATPYVLFYKKRTVSLPPPKLEQKAFSSQLSAPEKVKSVVSSEFSWYSAFETYMREKGLLIPRQSSIKDVNTILDALKSIVSVETVQHYQLDTNLDQQQYNSLQALLDNAVSLKDAADVLVFSTRILASSKKEPSILDWPPVLNVNQSNYVALGTILRDKNGDYSYATDDMERFLSPKIDSDQRPALVVYYKLFGAQKTNQVTKALALLRLRLLVLAHKVKRGL